MCFCKNDSQQFHMNYTTVFVCKDFAKRCSPLHYAEHLENGSTSLIVMGD